MAGKLEQWGVVASGSHSAQLGTHSGRVSSGESVVSLDPGPEGRGGKERGGEGRGWDGRGGDGRGGRGKEGYNGILLVHTP